MIPSLSRHCTILHCFRCSEVILGSRALSHESIFVADEVLADPEPSRVLSHENVHTKIKALQVSFCFRAVVVEDNFHDNCDSAVKWHQSVFKMSQAKLQQQKMHLGPPSTGLSLKRPDHLTRASASQEALNKVNYPGQVIIMLDYNVVISRDQ